MPKVPLLLGLAAALAAVAVLLLALTESGPAPEAATAPAVRPGVRSAATRDADLAAPGAAEAPAESLGSRVEARPRPKVKLGAETARVAGRDERDGRKLTGRAVGLHGIGVGGAKVKIEAIGPGADGPLQLFAGSTDQEAVTDASGNFRASLPRRWEEVAVTVDARGYLPYRETHELADRDGDQDLGQLALEAAVVLGGRVLSAEGEPVAGAEIRRVEDDSRTAFSFRSRPDATTDGEGRFELPNEEPGSYVLDVRHPEHPTGRFTGETPRVGGEDLTLELQLLPAASIAGRITGYPPDGRPYVLVVAEPVQASGAVPADELRRLWGRDELKGEVDPEGGFEVRGLEAGRRYELRAVVREGFGDRVPRSDERVAMAGERDVRLVWDQGATVRFRVVDARTANRVQDVLVRYRFEEEGRSGMPDWTKKRAFQDGEVELTELFPGAGASTLSIQISAPGYLELRRDGIGVPRKGEAALGTFRLEPAATVRVVVVDAEGEAVSGARVRLEPEEDRKSEDSSGWFSLKMNPASGRTGPDGTCPLPAPATPTARLEVSHPRFSDFARAGVPLPTQGEREERIRLGRGGTVTVVVTDAAGEPVRGVTVQHRYPDEGANEPRHETNRRGEVRLRKQPAGEHAFRVAPDDAGPDAPAGEEGWTALVVLDDREAELVLRVAARGRVTGRVTEGGRPLSGATVELVAAQDGDATAGEIRIVGGARVGRRISGSSDRTDQSGAYAIDDVPAGRYRLSVRHDTRAAAHLVPLEVRPSSNRLDVDLPLTAIEGRVTDAAGAPVADARVRLVAAPRREDGEDANERELAREALRALFTPGDAVRSDAQGAYRLVGVLEEVPVQVEASAEGYVRARSRVLTVTGGGVARGVDVSLERGSTLRVRLEGARPFTFVYVTWDGPSEDAPSPETAMLRDGVAVIQGLKPGPWRVRRGGRDGDAEGVRVDVPPRGEASVDLAP